MGWRTLTLLLASTLTLSGCALPLESASQSNITLPPPPTSVRGNGSAPTPDTGNFLLVWGQGANPDESYRAQLEAWVDALNAKLALPHDITITEDTCGIQNAYYDRDTKTVVLCEELANEIDRAMNDPQLSATENAQAKGGAWLYVALHETGHALIDAYQLPITGREEDAADDFATITLLDAGDSQAALDAATYWGINSQRGISEEQFADEHSLDAQRYYDLLCTIYGSDPGRYQWLVDETYLPHTRAQRCDNEYERKDASWERLLGAWTKS